MNSGIIDLKKTPDLYDKAAILEEEVFKVLAEAQKGHKTELKIAVGVEDFVRAFGGSLTSLITVDLSLSLHRHVMADGGHHATRTSQLYSLVLTLQTHGRATDQVLSNGMRADVRSADLRPQSYRSFFNLKKGPKEDIKKVSRLLIVQAF